MAESRTRVLVAGGGVAGLEALYALRALAGERVEITLIAPDDEFVYRPLAVEKPFEVGRVRRVPLTRAALQAGAELLSTTVKAVDRRRRLVTTSGGDQLRYDALLLAVGATSVPVVPKALTWDDRADSEALGGLLRDIDEDYSHSVAVVIPDGPAWPLRDTSSHWWWRSKRTAFPRTARPRSSRLSRRLWSCWAHAWSSRSRRDWTAPGSPSSLPLESRWSPPGPG